MSGSSASSNPFFELGVKYDDWRPLATYVEPGTGRTKAVVAEAPGDADTGKPYLFLYRNEGTGELVEILDSDMLLLGIAVAHVWATTDKLDGISDVEIAQLLVAVSLPMTDEFFLKMAKNAAEARLETIKK